MLTPANADDLRMTGKMSPSFDSNDCDSKAVQVKVPVVATVTQNIQADGKINFIIEPPSSDQEQGNKHTKKLIIFYIYTI